MQIDGAVREPVVAKVAGRQLGRGLERGVGVRDADGAPRTGAQAGEDRARVSSIDRLVDRDLLQTPRQRAVLLDVLELLEGRRADDAQVAGASASA